MLPINKCGARCQTSLGHITAQEPTDLRLDLRHLQASRVMCSSANGNTDLTCVSTLQQLLKRQP